MAAKKKKASAHPWRENLEALTMAVAVALLFKVFILEISKIPSGSMQPTMMGSPAANVFDRVLVDKLSYGYRDPERFEIVVFKHPLERFEIVVFKHPLEQSRIMVKRLVGMPGESLKIEHGDLWTRTNATQTWEHLRRPPRVQRAMWRRLDRLDRRTVLWYPTEGSGWLVDGRDIDARGPGVARYRAGTDSIVDRYSDGYHDSLRDVIGDDHPESGRHAVGDLRLEGELEMDADTVGVIVRLTEGRETYAFGIPGPASDEDTPSILWSGLVVDGREPVEARAEEAWRLEADDAVDFAIENLDDRLTLELDGEAVLSLDVDPQARQHATLALEVLGGGARFEELTVYRDIYYYPFEGRSSWEQEIPEDAYVMLGDNTQDSADSRAWEFVSMTWESDAGLRTEEGNFRMGQAQPNPVSATFPEELGWAFRDVWGERHWIPLGDLRAGPIPGVEHAGTPGPFVPRHLVLGRAMAVFWPIKPVDGLWRLGWVH